MGRDELRTSLVGLLEGDRGEKYEHIDDDDNLRESLGLDSVDLAALVIHMQSRWNIEFRMEELNQTTTVSHLLDLLQVKIGAAMKPAA